MSSDLFDYLKEGYLVRLDPYWGQWHVIEGWCELGYPLINHSESLFEKDVHSWEIDIATMIRYTATLYFTRCEVLKNQLLLGMDHKECGRILHSHCIVELIS